MEVPQFFLRPELSKPTTSENGEEADVATESRSRSVMSRLPRLFSSYRDRSNPED